MSPTFGLGVRHEGIAVSDTDAWEHSPKVSLMRWRLRTSDIVLLILLAALLWVLGSYLLRALR